METEDFLRVYATTELRLNILARAALMPSSTHVITAYFPKHIRLWFGLHEPACSEQHEDTGWAKRNTLMWTQTNVNPIKTIMHHTQQTHTHTTKHRWKENKGMASANTMCCGLLSQVAGFHTMGSFITQKDRTHKQPMKEQQEVYTGLCRLGFPGCCLQ